MGNTFDRYALVRNNMTIGKVPFVEIPVKETDIYVEYQKGVTRMDLLSYDYYNDANFGWLILQANPQYGALEFNIPDKAELRIPYPLDASLNDYKVGLNKKLNL